MIWLTLLIPAVLGFLLWYFDPMWVFGGHNQQTGEFNREASGAPWRNDP